ncbi:DUF2630 family protein [Thermobifida fusca]|jgi:hypothetical protein|uniref:DUF2630 family protein n=2 Tax=Thermobifida fusca TaxID=2021 RepID=A0A9P2TCV9_THEFU|nr:DUF2630 family protein [Thermobifida fusca]EOR71961.1 hypothetical protein TM51_05162 [Thermobifida fusca TM51]MDD6792069.1 DUF2630 family protein [Thermobifida fusca]PZN65092.1 MAG: DUF2630 domain-containing protein [Thermobifida fusca]
MNGQHTREEELIRQIGELVTEERALRQQPGHRLSAAEYERIKQVERALDQCWDLLRQRRAKEEFGENPDEARPRSISQVEEYQQ